MPNLFDKIYGCIAASRIGSSMGTLTEGWSVSKSNRSMAASRRWPRNIAP